MTRIIKILAIFATVSLATACNIEDTGGQEGDDAGGVDGGADVDEGPVVSQQYSSIVGESGLPADGESQAQVTITLLDTEGQPLSDIVPDFDATGVGNEYGECSPTDEDGVSHCTMTATYGGPQTLWLRHPVELEGGSIEFRTLFWGANSQVRTVAIDNSHIYLGGSFSFVGPPTGSFVEIDRSDDGVLPGWPTVLGSVFAAIPDDEGGWYIGGDFTRVGDVERLRLAHIEADGTVNPDFSVEVGGTVRALALDGNRLYVGGSITSIGGEGRIGVGAVDADDGSVHGWDPSLIRNSFSSVHGEVHAMAVDEGTIFIGGRFHGVSGETDFHNIAEIDKHNGEPTSWRPRLYRPVTFGPSTGVVRALQLDEGVVLAGGDFTRVNGVDQMGLVELSKTDGEATDWNMGPLVGGGFSTSAQIMSFVEVEDVLYLGGNFTGIDGEERSYLAAVDRQDGSLLEWAPEADAPVTALAAYDGELFIGGGFEYIDGQQRPRMASMDIPQTELSEWNPRASGAPHMLLPTEDTVHAAGIFSSVGGYLRHNLAALDRRTGEVVTSWEANTDFTVYALALSHDLLFVGGSFREIDGQQRDFVAAVNGDTGAVQDWIGPEFDSGNIRALAVDDQRVYVGGLFSTVDGNDHYGIAALDRTSAQLSSDWTWDFSTDPDRRVTALAVADDILYAGGSFTEIGAEQRHNIAALDTSDGLAISGWNPDLDGRVEAIAVGEDRIYVGGHFDSIDDEGISHLAALEIADGSLTDWRPEPDSTVDAIAVGDDVVYVGGYFMEIGDANRQRLTALTKDTALAGSWAPRPSDVIHSIEWVGPFLYVGGGFLEIDGRLQPRFSSLLPAQ